MKITIFTSNQPRHISLVNKLSEISESTYAVIETKDLSNGVIKDFYKPSPIMEEYFRKVNNSEANIFGEEMNINSSVESLVINNGELSNLDQDTLRDALDSDLYVVFGSSYIKGWLVNHLISRKTINIHMGISPFYRGVGCNFWALYDLNPDLVGATIHMISKGIDSGGILWHCFPKYDNEDPFDFTMKSVLSAHSSIVNGILSKEIFELSPTIQDKNKEKRFSRSSDFNDAVIEDFTQTKIHKLRIEESIDERDEEDFINMRVL